MLKKSIGFLIISIVITLSAVAQSNDDAKKLGREIFNKYQEAIGGKENLAKIKTIEIKSETERSGAKTTDIEITDRANKKNYVRSERSDGWAIEMGSDGSRSWLRQGGRSNYITFDAEAETLEYIKVKNEKIDGKEYLVVEEKKSDSSKNSKGFYDPETFLLVRREKTGSFNGSSLKFVTLYSDYRKVGDILVPFLEISENAMSGKSIKKIISVKHKTEISPSVFELNPESKKKEEEELAKKKAALELLGFDSSTLGDLSDNQLKDFKSKNVTYQDENGKTISEKEYEEKIAGGNYGRGLNRIVNGKVTVRLKKIEVNIPAPDFTGTLLDGSTVQLSSLKGKVVVLNFWFTACSPCIKEMPELNELVKQFQSQKDVEFYSITYNTKDEVAKFLTKHKFDYQPIVNAENILETFKNPAYPTHIVIDREGKILLSQLGYSPKIKEKLIEKIETALKSAS